MPIPTSCHQEHVAVAEHVDGSLLQGTWHMLYSLRRPFATDAAIKMNISVIDHELLQLDYAMNKYVYWDFRQK